jgi:hypothetical protein
MPDSAHAAKVLHSWEISTEQASRQAGRSYGFQPQIDYLGVRMPPPTETFARVVVGVDPSGGNRKTATKEMIRKEGAVALSGFG